MKAYDFIKSNIGARVRVWNNRDLAFEYTMRQLMSRDRELYLVRLSRGGMAIIKDNITGMEYSVPPYGIRLYNDPENH